MTKETIVNECVKECKDYETTKVYNIGETLKFVLDGYGSLYPYDKSTGIFFREGYKMIECEIKDIADIKLSLDYPVKNIYEDEQVLPNNHA